MYSRNWIEKTSKERMILKDYRKRKSLSVRARLIWAFTMTLLIPSIAIGIFSYMKSDNLYYNELSDKSRENVDLINSLVTKEISPIINDAEYLAAYFNKDWQDADALKELDKYNALHNRVSVVALTLEAIVFYVIHIMKCRLIIIRFCARGI